MKLDLHYVEPRLVDMYDIENSRGADTDFYVALAAQLYAETIVDLGCGTGILTRELTTPSRQVYGVDPAPAMLAYARRQPGAENVTWIDGTASAIGERQADLAVMTGNVAQVFLDDAEWTTTLKALHTALKSGGHLAFESRNPAAKAWQQWNPNTTFARFGTPHGSVETWLEVVAVGEKTVSFRGHNRFKDSGDVLVVESTLRFRTFAEITASLERAGFIVEHVYGDWQRKPFAESDHAMIFVAKSI